MSLTDEQAREYIAAGMSLTLDDMDEIDIFPEKDLAQAREHEMRRQRERAKKLEDEQLNLLRKAKLIEPQLAT